jgi:hypothetical protein
MSRRWQLTIMIVAALSVFIALVAGSSLRPPLGAAALPEPAAWTHPTDAVGTPAGEVQRHGFAQSVSHQGQGFSKGSTPTDKKPFRNTWMTKDRPTSWTHWSPQSGFSVLPASFASHPDGHACPASAAAPDIRDILTQLCVVRC